MEFLLFLFSFSIHHIILRTIMLETALTTLDEATLEQSENNFFASRNNARHLADASSSTHSSVVRWPPTCVCRAVGRACTSRETMHVMAKYCEWKTTLFAFQCRPLNTYNISAHLLPRSGVHSFVLYYRIATKWIKTHSFCLFLFLVLCTEVHLFLFVRVRSKIESFLYTL